MYVVPSNKALKIRNPLTMQHVPPEGCEVAGHESYWKRRKRDGDIEILTKAPKKRNSRNSEEQAD